jgi:ubiquinone/menaquinone biosynthesis C-methylase UbiE
MKASDGSETAKGHSEDYFGAYCDLWWNTDFLALMARGLKLAECRQALEVGFGRGHWTRALASHLAPGTNLIGVDSVPKWPADNQTWQSKLAENGIRFASRSADVCELPFEDETFDSSPARRFSFISRSQDSLGADVARLLPPLGQSRALSYQLP